MMSLYYNNYKQKMRTTQKSSGKDGASLWYNPLMQM